MEQSQAKKKGLSEVNPRGEVVVRKVEFQPLSSPGTVPLKQEISPAFLGVNLELTAELGKTNIKIKDLINMEEGSLLKLDRLADESVLLLVNETPFAQGEIVVINERFGVRVTSFVHEQRE